MFTLSFFVQFFPRFLKYQMLKIRITKLMEEKMKRIIRPLALILIFCIFCGINARAEGEALNWYIKKRGNNCPDFPSESQMVSENGGYYVDSSDTAVTKKILYLTFDTGYENGNVEKILDILSAENVPGAFFILSNLIVKNGDLVKRMFDDGHLVCNHTKNHKDMTKLTSEEMTANLKALEELCFEKTGCRMEKYFRFPEGRYSERTIKNASLNGYKTFFWSLTHADWDNQKQPSPDKAIKILMDNTHNGAVILLHPTSAANVKILPILIKKWKEQGYSFGTLHELVANMEK